MTKERLRKIGMWLGIVVLLASLRAMVWYIQEGPATAVMGRSIDVTHVTSGVIEADTIIAVRFRDEQVPSNTLGRELAKNPFSFSPSIEGKAYWEDTRTLVFEPSEPLYNQMDYHAVLHLANGDEKLELAFAALGQRVMGSQGSFEPTDAKDETRVYFQGEITLSERVSIDTLSQALDIMLEGRPLQVELKTEDNLTFLIKSEELERFEHQSRLLQLTLEGERLGLDEDIKEDRVLSALQAPLTVLRIEEEKDSDYSRLRIVFSDPLSDRPDYKGYLNISPAIDYNVKADGGDLVISGDFRPREKYSVQLFPGIEGAHGQRLEESADYVWEVAISDRNPAVEFINSGFVLTSSANKKIAFRTMNVQRLRLQVKKVGEDNLIAFFEDHSYRPNNDSFVDYNRYRFLRFGEVIEDRLIEIGKVENRWVQSELDLSQVIAEDDCALYIIQLDFDETQALYFSDDLDMWDISNRVYQRGRAVKHLLVSDMGITVKELPGELYVFLTDLLTTESLSQAVVMLKDRAGTLLESAKTDELGIARLDKTDGGRYIEVCSGDKHALMRLDSSLLNQALFDIGGVQKQAGVNAFIYTERGVYRPGDQINISAIVRNEDDTFPENHPVILRVYDPQGRLHHEAVATKARDGFYSFNFVTASTAPTGTWKAALDIGGRLFPHELRIEEIVPHRIRVDIETPQERLSSNQEHLDFTLRSEYLFGAPASGLQSETTVTMEPYNISFPTYDGFVFANDTIHFNSVENMFFLRLDEEGQAELSWTFPKLRAVPSALRLRIDSRVLESGGRAVPQTKVIPVDHYPSYVGIMELENSQLSMGEEANLQVVHLTQAGMPLAESQLDYTIYRLKRYWWWEYDSQTSFRRHYKSDEQLMVDATGTVTTNSAGLARIDYRPDDYGEVLLEVKDPVGGHSAAYFFSSYWWGDSPKTVVADVVGLKVDKERYLPGETARVSLATPTRGRALVTVEKDGAILYQSWEEITQSETVIELEVRQEYIPNAYVSVIVHQPFEQTENDLPLRIYGIVPLHVASVDTRIELSLELPETIRPEEKFTLAIQTADHRPVQFTVAVVDEGLLNLTRFKTPDPWSHFFSKERLLTKTYDNFSDVIGPGYGYNYHLFTVGGDGEAAPPHREQQTPKGDVSRFEAVSIFSGPLETDAHGYAEVELEIPNYIGSVKVMVVAAAEGHYGSASQDVPVKAPLMVMPTLPRVLGPLDQITLPVTVFALEEELGEVTVRLDASGPVAIQGEREIDLSFSTAESQEVFFQLMAGEEVGVASIAISAYAPTKDYRNESRTSLPIRPPNPYIYLSTEEVAEPDQVVDFAVPPGGVPGTDSVQVTISPLRGLNINHRLKWLMRYPYGCLEQVTSAVFPQLYLPEVFSFSPEQLSDMDENLNAAIQAFRQYQLKDGGFSYWPGGSVANQWATNYAGHFLLEAQSKGYYVPADLLTGWTNFQTNAARENKGDDFTRAYRLYLLTLAEKPVMSLLNYMRESELDRMGNPEKYLLAAAYHLQGYPETSKDILADTSFDVNPYDEHGRTFGSKLRDQAVLLDVLVVTGDHKRGTPLYNEIARALSSNQWYSTQTTAYSLLALSKYVTAVSSDTPVLTGELSLAHEALFNLEHNGIVAVIPISSNGGESLAFHNTTSTPLFVTLEWEGIPREGDLKPQRSNLILTVDYYDEAGVRLDVTRLKQGTSFYAVFRVSQAGYEDLNELALVQILPAGWEIENLRLLGGQLPEWTSDYYLEMENYLDLRDDRIMWFFDMAGWVDSYDFIVKLNAVTVGEFYLPPTLLEAMYNNDYRVVTSGQTVEVTAR